MKSTTDTRLLITMKQKINMKTSKYCSTSCAVYKLFSSFGARSFQLPLWFQCSFWYVQRQSFLNTREKKNIKVGRGANTRTTPHAKSATDSCSKFILPNSKTHAHTHTHTLVESDEKEECAPIHMSTVPEPNSTGSCVEGNRMKKKATEAK